MVTDDDCRSLFLRAAGGFALTMTCAAHVQPSGQGFRGQLGIFSDKHIEGLSRLADGIARAGSVASVQLHHAGVRADPAYAPEVVGPSDHIEPRARGLTTIEVQQLRDDFVLAARRAEIAGFPGVELHGAHGYLLAQFLSPEFNRREDQYGGSPENRARLLLEIVEGIRASCSSHFQLGLRLSPERYGLDVAEMRDLANVLFRRGTIDYLDLSLWDIFKEAEDPAFAGRPLLSHFTELERGPVRLAAAGKILGAETAAHALAAGCDFVMIGRAAVLVPDFPMKVHDDARFVAPSLPTTAKDLTRAGWGPGFIDYVSSWPGFLQQP
jgi:2,4-dienoyl-CoA reductase-like NADH-dependent reductase (Old Yellow Enzyme family)